MNPNACKNEGFKMTYGTLSNLAALTTFILG
jgi:hypothetical protein